MCSIPPPLRDLLLQLAVSDLFHAKWSADIHREQVGTGDKHPAGASLKLLTLVEKYGLDAFTLFAATASCPYAR